MGKTVRIIQIIILTAGLLACGFFIGLHMKTKGAENTAVNAVNQTKIVSEIDQR